MPLVETTDACLAYLPWTAFFTFGVTFASCAVGFAIEARWGSRRRIFALELAKGQLRWEFWANLRFCVLSSLTFAVVLGVDALGPFEETWSARVFSFLFLWVGFDAYYYWLHRALHLKPLMPFHRLHHKSHVCTALTGFSLGWVESAGWIVGWVAFALAAAELHALSLGGLVAYAVVIFVANVLGHTNTEWLPRVFGSRAMSWGNHPITFHALHHARYEKHFSFAFTVFDRLFGTEWQDWRSLFLRVVEGRPMTRLQERGQPEPSQPEPSQSEPSQPEPSQPEHRGQERLEPSK